MTGEIAPGGIACDKHKIIVLTAEIGRPDVACKQIFRFRLFVMQTRRDDLALTARRPREGSFGLFGQLAPGGDQHFLAARTSDADALHFVVSPIVLHRGPPRR